MRALPVLLCLASLIPWSGTLVAADDPVAALAKVMGSEDADAKRQAIRALASKSAGNDEAAIAALITALADRQAGEAAASTLASRTGAHPENGAWRPGIESSKLSAAWQGWYDKWKVENALKKKKEPEKAIAAARAGAASEAVTPQAVSAPRFDPGQDDLGKLDRISFVDGGSMLCYVRSRRSDADGNLLSIQVVHRDGRGTETLAAALIARIDEDVE